MNFKLPNQTEVNFASFLSGGFTTMAIINPPERKLAKRTSVMWTGPNQSKYQIMFYKKSPPQDFY